MPRGCFMENCSTSENSIYFADKHSTTQSPLVYSSRFNGKMIFTCYVPHTVLVAGNTIM